MLKWINILHIYQPPGQEQGILRWIADESYYHLLYLLRQYPEFKITLNISGSLTRQLEHKGFYNLLDKLKKYVENGQIELTESAMYHPILPLLPKEEIERQIFLNEEINRKNFGHLYKPKGFFLPEMAYSKKVADAIKEKGYEWIALDEIHFPKNKEINPEIKYTIAGNGLNVVFRNREFSKSYPPEKIIKSFKKIKDSTLITAHDGEMYGHWHKDEGLYYEKIFKNPNIEMLNVSEYLEGLEDEKTITPREASWETTAKDLEDKNPFPLWNDPQNKIHKMLWQLRNLAIETIKNKEEDPGWGWSRHYLDQGLASCSWWWASDRQPDVFTPQTWNPTEIEKGLNFLIKSIRSIKTADKEKRMKAEKIYLELLELIWEKHWNHNHKENEDWNNI